MIDIKKDSVYVKAEPGKGIGKDFLTAYMPNGELIPFVISTTVKTTVGELTKATIELIVRLEDGSGITKGGDDDLPADQ